MKIKVIHIVQPSYGGVLEYIYYFLKNFKDDKYENYMIASDQHAEHINEIKKYCKKIYIVPMKREINIKTDIMAILKIKKIIKKIQPHILYLHSSKAGGLGRLALLFNLKVKIFYNAHGWYFNADISPRKKKVYALIEKMLAIKTDMIINISKNEYITAQKYKIAPAKKMCIIENGIDFLKFENCEYYRANTRKKYKIKDDEILIGVLARISEQKDPMTMIKAFNEVYKECKNVKLMYAGSGNLEKRVQKYVEENNLKEKVIFTGWVKNVEECIPAFDIAVLPSKWEGFGLVLIEYMACNKPIVASSVGGIKDIIIDNKNGLLFKKEDYKELSEKIKILIGNNNLAKNFVQTNKEYRKKYDIKNLIEKHIELFEKYVKLK